MNKLRIGLDIDDTLGDFYGHYKSFFNAEKNPRVMEDKNITKNVCKLRTNKDFWLSLPKIILNQNCTVLRELIQRLGVENGL